MSKEDGKVYADFVMGVWVWRDLLTFAEKVVSRWHQIVNQVVVLLACLGDVPCSFLGLSSSVWTVGVVAAKEYHAILGLLAEYDHVLASFVSGCWIVCHNEPIDMVVGYHRSQAILPVVDGIVQHFLVERIKGGIFLPRGDVHEVVHQV